MTSFPAYCFVLFLLTVHPGGQSSPLPFSSPRSHAPQLRSDHPLATCTDCGGQELAAHIKQNIKQRQTLHSLKTRIMKAINKSENSSAATSFGFRPISSGLSGVSFSGTKSPPESGRRIMASGHHVTISDRSPPKTAREGTAIFSLSRLVSSSRRKNVLQFTLNPSERQEGKMEVVKAHLWLLLGSSHRKSGKGRRKVKVADRSLNDSDVPRVRRQVEENTATGQLAGDGAGVSGHKHEQQEQRKKSKDGRLDEDPEASRDGSRKKGKRENGGNKGKRKAVVRILLVEPNGRKRLLTYLRTSVKKTHWHKLSLPVGLVQHHLQQNNPTLTLMLRCSRCGRSMRMLPQLTSGDNSRVKKSRKQTTRQGRRRGNKKGGKRKRKEVQLRSGRDKYSLRKARRLFRPSAVLVINTRVQPSAKSD